ncbi:MAG: hypothetical protein VXY26_04665 [Bacteroidota bacterium]|nr:hypothetical protein [Bacteroidota bacterium]
MKRIILTFVAVTVMLFSTNAQTKKGTILLGAGSQLSETSWTDLAITPKIGYFIQDGLALGAMIHFNTDDQYFPSYDGIAVPNAVTGATEIIGAHDEYTLTNNSRTFGVFGRYYAARNLFMEVNMSSSTTQSEEWGTMSSFDVDAGGNISLVQTEGVMQSRSQSTHVGFGMGYTLVMREHIAIEPYVALDLIVDGERVSTGNESVDLSGSSFIAGVNFSLFF